MAMTPIHGLCDKVPEYSTWKSMRARCNYKKDKCYKYYGGRGIRVCKRWDSFLNFYNDMGPRPSKEYSLDRVNSNGNYTPKNCRWATIMQQARNRRKQTVFPQTERKSRLGIRGVHQIPSGSFRAIFRRKSLGCFKTILEAAISYNKAATEFYGKYACLNIIK